MLLKSDAPPAEGGATRSHDCRVAQAGLAAHELSHEPRAQRLVAVIPHVAPARLSESQPVEGQAPLGCGWAAVIGSDLDNRESTWSACVRRRGRKPGSLAHADLRISPGQTSDQEPPLHVHQKTLLCASALSISQHKHR